jgi:peptide/nickel transport system permease protein
MKKLIWSKLKFFGAVFVGLVCFIFFLFMALPSPEQILTGQRSDKATTEAIVKDLGLDQALGVQLLMYFNDLSPVSFYAENSPRIKQAGGLTILKTGNTVCRLKWPYLRSSFQTRRPVSSMLSDAFAGTLVLAFSAMLFALLLGIPLGVLAAIQKGKRTDKLLVAFSALGISVPAFFSAMLVAWVFGFVLHDYTGLGMTGSLWEIDQLGEGYHLSLKNLILPAFALGIRPLAVFIQLTRNAMVDVLSQDFVRTARAKGLSENKVIWVHAFPNAINPLVTSVGGWLSSLLAGSFFTEFIFNWKGLGKLGIEALQNSDLPVIMGTVLFTTIIFFFVSIVTEMAYIWIDPRLRYE